MNWADTIYVRVYEGRMDLLRAVIIGPTGTPYHDGLFTFDVHFPKNYPDVPPVCVFCDNYYEIEYSCLLKLDASFFSWLITVLEGFELIQTCTKLDMSASAF